MKPSFLKGTVLSKSDKNYFTDITSNWLKINARLNDFTEEEIKKMILLELQGHQRLHILHRLKRRYDRVRGDRERGEMLISGSAEVMVGRRA